VIVHLVDGTFELFRCFHGAPRVRHRGVEVGAARGLFATLVSLLAQADVTHLAVAFDSVVAPPARKGTGDEALIAAQAPLAAEVVRALGVALWPSGRYQADELLATAAARFADERQVGQVVICSTDNDFNQCVRGDRVVVLDRIRGVVTNEAAVRTRFGVAPQQLPDLHALVGDRSDGLPGVPGWGLRAGGVLLARYGSIEAIPTDPDAWDVPVRGAARLAGALAERFDETMLCRDLARLRTDLPLRQSAADLEWRGAHRSRIDALCATLGDDASALRLQHWAHATGV
jgi:5'-3' exonuclease